MNDERDNDGSERDHGSRGDIDVAGDDAKRRADRKDREDGALIEESDDVAQREKRILERREPRGKERDADEKRVVR